MPGSITDAGTENGGVLTLAAVPIGRADDASARLVAELAGASLIAAEDTRRVRWLASSLNIELNARVVSYYDASSRAAPRNCLASSRPAGTSCS
jgi:16S rRNA (cytidine1402-2'-O)-methyltransferase